MQQVLIKSIKNYSFQSKVIIWTSFLDVFLSENLLNYSKFYLCFYFEAELNSQILDLVRCPPVCAVFCPFGNVLDSNGCKTCRCKGPSFDLINTRRRLDRFCGYSARMCDMHCEHGRVLDPNGCPTCECVHAETTPIAPIEHHQPGHTCGVVCMLFCEGGMIEDEFGCPTCKCKHWKTVIPSTPAPVTSTTPISISIDKRKFKLYSTWILYLLNLVFFGSALQALFVNVGLSHWLFAWRERLLYL
jgi:hypothetical protein